MNKTYFVVLQVNTALPIEDVLSVFNHIQGPAINTKVIQTEEADKEVVEMDGPPTLMYP